MKSAALTVTDYLASLEPERREVMEKLRRTALKHLPKGFAEVMNYGMLGYVVPHALYPDGYHCDPKLPLPFINLASQKNFVALYHMGLYADPKLLQWFTAAWAKHTPVKIDMGKSCLRMKKLDAIPYALLGELFEKFTVKAWVSLYESAFRAEKPAKPAQAAKAEKPAKPAPRATREAGEARPGAPRRRAAAR